MCIGCYHSYLKVRTWEEEGNRFNMLVDGLPNSGRVHKKLLIIVVPSGKGN